MPADKSAGIAVSSDPCVAVEKDPFLLPNLPNVVQERRPLGRGTSAESSRCHCDDATGPQAKSASTTSFVGWGFGFGAFLASFRRRKVALGFRR